MSKTLATLNVLVSKMLMMASSLKQCPEVLTSCKSGTCACLLDVADMDGMRATVMHTCLREACELPLGG